MVFAAAIGTLELTIVAFTNNRESDTIDSSDSNSNSNTSESSCYSNMDNVGKVDAAAFLSPSIDLTPK